MIHESTARPVSSRAADARGAAPLSTGTMPLRLANAQGGPNNEMVTLLNSFINKAQSPDFNSNQLTGGEKNAITQALDYVSNQGKVDIPGVEKSRFTEALRKKTLSDARSSQVQGDLLRDVPDPAGASWAELVNKLKGFVAKLAPVLKPLGAAAALVLLMESPTADTQRSRPSAPEQQRP